MSPDLGPVAGPPAAPTLAELATATGGVLLPAAGGERRVVGEVVIDSRLVGAGDLFVAVPGQRVDGHDYTAAALTAGAVGVVVQREPAESLPGPALLVPDTTKALAAVAHHEHQRLAAAGLVTVGITGSAGKTTTKDLVTAVLRAVVPTGAGPLPSPAPARRPGDPVVGARGSFNNELGLPLTVLRAGPATRALVLEMGARGRGHIAMLCRSARPTVGAVLLVGSAHLGEFGSREAIAEAKGELVEALDADGCAVLNADDPLVRAMASRTAAPALLVGEGEEAAVRALDVRLDGDSRVSFTLAVRGGPLTATGTAPVRLRLVGAHHVTNALAAAGIALAVLERLDPAVVPTGAAAVDAVAAAISAAEPESPHRMQVLDRPDGVRIVNDAYNASPEAVAAALRALAVMGRADGGQPRRTWAVLGEMLELGEESIAAHDRVGRLAVRLDVNRLVAVGSGAMAIHTGARQEGSWGEESDHVPDPEAAFELLAAELRPGDVVLVKASNSVGLWRLGERLAAGEARAATS